MKKYLLALALLLISLSSIGQSVLGIPFGCSYEDVKQSLIKRNVGDNTWEQDGRIIVTNGYIGNIPFGLGVFYFQFKENKSYLSAAAFSDVELTAVEAKKKREEFAKAIRDKYFDSFTEYIDEKGFKRYEFGENPLNKEAPLGKIFIFHNKNEKKYDAVLYYGPIHYIEPNSDF
ncbi:hypothetical protein [Prevotella sp. KH2C16]|uniref:hypothetical protein n=1 Tax=Prevotella sp. KH2C16 TaxID=1855325 RepID=UPI0008E6F47E|nr:hypothetical protein [Prevotella sp. KH2C16]SFG56589.1 hypothetical protein SAMN05216383_12066 [Prevotella sp. KH2C16]